MLLTDLLWLDRRPGGAGAERPAAGQRGGGSPGQSRLHPRHLRQDAEHLGRLLPPAERISRQEAELLLSLAVLEFHLTSFLV